MCYCLKKSHRGWRMVYVVLYPLEVEVSSASVARFLIIVAVVLSLFIIGCGKDDAVSPEQNGDNDGPPPNTPAIPMPTYPGEALPEKSDSLILEEVQILTFAPKNALAPDTIAAFTGMPYNYVNTLNNQVTLVDEGQIVDPVYVPFKGCTEPDCSWGLIFSSSFNCHGVGHIPLIQYLRYWQKIFSTVIQYPSNYMESHTYTEGTSETTGESFSYTLGLSGQAYGIGLSAELTKTFTYSITISSESSITKEFSCPSIEGKTIVFTVWQLVEGFRICNADSSCYTDHTFNHMVIPVIDNATSTLYMSVVQF